MGSMLEQLFYTHLEIALTLSVVIAALLALGALLRRRYTVRWRYWAWLVVAARLLVPFNLSLPAAVRLPAPAPLVISDAAPPPAIPSQGNAEPVAPVGPEDPGAADQALDTAEKSIPVAALAAMAWLAGAVGFWAVQGVSAARLRRLLRRYAQPAAVEEQVLLEQLAAELCVRRIPRLLRCPGVPGPMVTGLFHPVLLLPEARYAAGDLEMIVRHELTHLQRRDLLYKLLMTGAVSLHWYNPLVWCMAREASRDLEIACDDAVVRGRGAAFRDRYGDALLSSMRTGMAGGLLYTSFRSGKRTMQRRLVSLFDTGRKHRGALALLAVTLAAVLVGGLVACGTPAADPAGSGRSESSGAVGSGSSDSSGGDSSGPANDGDDGTESTASGQPDNGLSTLAPGKSLRQQDGQYVLVDDAGTVLQTCNGVGTAENGLIVLSFTAQPDDRTVYQLYYGGEQIGPDYDYVSCCNLFDGISTYYEADNGGWPPAPPYSARATENGARRCYLLGADGKPLHEGSFADLELFDEQAAAVDDAGNLLHLSRDGALLSIDEAGPRGTLADGALTLYGYYAHAMGAERRLQVRASDGENLFPQFAGGFCRVDAPLDDRLVLFDGTMQFMGASVAYIADNAGHILSEAYNYVAFWTLDGGGYVGVGGIADDADPDMQRVDETGAPAAPGFYFIDRDGRPVSERIDCKSISRTEAGDFSVQRSYDDADVETLSLEQVLAYYN